MERAPLSQFAGELEDAIERGYRGSGNSLGWRLLYSPVHVLDGADVALIGLNPGGNVEDPAHASFAMEHGSAYRDEIWPAASKVQQQVLALFTLLRVRPENVLAGNLVPYRSPGWSDLRNPEAALALGLAIWKRVLARAKPKLIVTMGAEANRAVSRCVGVRAARAYPVGWGDYTASRGTFSGGTWIGLPHLSRFAIMNRPESQDGLNALFAGLDGR